MKRLIISAWVLGLCAWCDSAPAQTNNVAPRANEVLADACRYLAQAPFFALTAEVWREHVTDSGKKLQFTRVVNMEIKRPNRMHVEIQSPHTDRGFW